MARPWVLAVLIVLLSPSGWAAWSQAGHDAGRTGVAEGEGPALDDIALHVRLPGTRAMLSGPVIVDGQLYVATSNDPGVAIPAPQMWARMNATENAVWRIDLTRGTTHVFAALEHAPFNLVANDRFVIVQHVRGVDVLDRATGRHLWAWESWTGHPVHEGTHHNFTWCPGMALAPAVPRLYVACTQVNIYPVGDNTSAPGRSARHESAGSAQVVVAALDLAAMQELWRWYPAEFDAESRQNYPEPVGEGPVVNAVFSGSMALSLLGERLGLVYKNLNVRVALMETTEGRVLREHVSPDATDRLDETNYLLLNKNEDWPTAPAGDAAISFFKLEDDLVAMNSFNGAELWRHRIRGEDISARGDFGIPLIVTNATVYVPSATGLRAVDRYGRADLWYQPLAPGDPDVFWQASNALAGTRLYGAAVHVAEDVEGPPVTYGVNDAYLPLVDRVSVRCLDVTRSGASCWTIEIPLDFPVRYQREVGRHVAALAVDAGLLVLATVDGQVVVVGKAPSGPRLEVVSSSPDPAPGSSVSVRVVNATGAAGATPVAYRADWGDGNVTDWQPADSFSHHYDAFGRYRARFQVRDAAGQTASAFLTFEVGKGGNATAPLALDEEEDPSHGPFGTLGPLAAAALLGATLLVLAPFIVLFVRHRRQSRLARELEAADRAFEAVRSDATAAEAVLQERRTHASRLLLRRRLTSREHAVLVGHLVALESTLARGPGAQVVDLRPGARVFGKYEVIRLLGEGAFGRAYLALDTLIDRPVVLKLLHRALNEDSLREARAIGAIRHPNVVVLHDVTRLGDQPLLVMEFAEGGSLSERLRAGPLGAAEFEEVTRGLLSALAAVHKAGAVHRDVKPSNVLLDGEGRVKLGDFGVAKLMMEEATAADGGLTVGAGTPRYMSPEQARGRRATERSDLYSAGVTLFEAWTGRPFVRADEAAGEGVMTRVANGVPFDRDIGPAPLRAWFETALAHEPARRYASADAMREAFDAAWAWAHRPRPVAAVEPQPARRA